MKMLKSMSLLTALVFFTSCAHNHGKHSCCAPGHGSKECRTGQCKKDASCCENKCGNCKGDKDDCSKGECAKHQTS